MENHTVAEQEETIDLLELLRVLRSKIIVLIVAFVVGAGSLFMYTKMFMDYEYESTSMIYVFSKSNSVSGMSLSDIQIGNYLTEDFVIVAKTRAVIDAVKLETGIDIPYEKMLGKINVSSPSDTRILKISARDTNPEVAASIANSMANQLRLRIAEVMDMNPPSIVESAIPATHPVAPSATRNGLIAGTGALAIVAAIVVIAYLLDDSIKNEDDVEKYLGETVLAVVPTVESYSRTATLSAKK